MLPRFASFIFLFIVIGGRAVAQGIPADASSRSVALGQSEIADPQDEWSPNPALRIDTSAHIRTMLAPTPEGLSGSYTIGFNGDAPLDNGLALGAGFLRYDYSDANFAWESISTQASKTFLVSGTDSDVRIASAGVRLRYGEQLLPAPYLPLEDLTLDLGAPFDLLPRLSAGVAVSHLFSIYNNQGDSIESRDAWIGLTFRATQDFTIHGALEAAGGEPSPAFRGGVSFVFDPRLVLRAGAVYRGGGGFASSMNELSAGFGIRTETMRADFAAVRHPDLGTFVNFGIGFAL